MGLGSNRTMQQIHKAFAKRASRMAAWLRGILAFAVAMSCYIYVRGDGSVWLKLLAIVTIIAIIIGETLPPKDRWRPSYWWRLFGRETMPNIPSGRSLFSERNPSIQPATAPSSKGPLSET